ncbi:DHA2 family efflux MFS transporter permease subunit [Streptomyces sp. NBC_01506]|uniref:DHA2 family efflux MFS transporter permease subunit n=1 Tax=Streptomyces sp. NBC_01506 TaxID=2903887 RepID=UPI00386EB467
MSPRGLSVKHTTAVSVVYVAAIFLSTMDTTIVNVALPTIGRAFSVESTSVDAVSISYLVSLAVFIPASGWLGDRFGGKRVLLAAVAVFTLASALCGLASGLGELIAFRLLQGAGGGMLVPVGMALMLRSFPPGERVRALAALTMANAIAPTIGPSLGGLLVTRLSWRWVFFVNVPVGVAAFVFGALFLRGTAVRRPGCFDLVGFLLSASGLGLLMYGVSQGPDLGWTARPVLAGVVAGAVLLSVLVYVESRSRAPLIDFRLFRDRLFRSGSAVMTLESVAFLSVIYTVSLYFQDGLGLGPLATGLSILPQALGVLTGSQVASRSLYRRLGPRRHLLVGVVGSSLCMALLAWVTVGGQLWCAWIALFGMGFSVGQVFVATQAASFATVSAAASGGAATLFNAGRRLGGAVGIAVATTAIVLVGVDTPVVGEPADDVGAYRVGFLVAAAINLLAVRAAWVVRDADAASTVPTARPRDGRDRPRRNWSRRDRSRRDRSRRDRSR